MKSEDEGRVEISLTLDILEVTASLVTVAKDFLGASILEPFYVRAK